MGGRPRSWRWPGSIMTATSTVRFGVLLPIAETASPAMPSGRVTCLPRGTAKPSRSAIPMPRAAWSWPTPWRSPARSAPTSGDYATLTGAGATSPGPELPQCSPSDDTLAADVQKRTDWTSRSCQADAAVDAL